MRRQYEHIGEIRERGAVGDRARKADLRGAVEQPEAHRIPQRFFDDGFRNSLGPIRIVQETMDDIDVQSIPLVGDREFRLRPLQVRASMELEPITRRVRFLAGK